MSVAVAIFVKTPGLSALKTRLWPNLGREAAERLHMACAEAVASVVAEAGRRHGMTAYWAVAEENATAHWPGFPCVEQGAGSLGERMARVYRRMYERHGAAIRPGPNNTNSAVFSWLPNFSPNVEQHLRLYRQKLQ